MGLHDDLLMNKKILENISYDKALFRKELIKSFGWLKSYELLELYKWVQDKYMHMHSDVISEVFNKEYVA